MKNKFSKEEYENAISVAITPNAGTYILYTVDGRDPNVYGTRYTGPINVDGKTTVKAVEAKDGWTNSPVASRSYTFKVAPVSINLETYDYKTEKNAKVAKSGRVVRSLHHIDDEDFEDTAEAARRRREALEAQEKADNEAKLAASGKKKGLIESAPIKDDKAEEKETDEVETTEDNKE